MGKFLQGQGMQAGNPAADGAPQMPMYNGNMNPQPNYWDGNNFIVPGMMPQQPQQQMPMQGLGQAMQGIMQAQRGSEKKPGFDWKVAALGGLPGLLMSGMGGMNDTSKGVLGGVFGGLSGLFK